jgi:hypothetical protein
MKKHQGPTLRRKFPARPLIDLFDADAPAAVIADMLGCNRKLITAFRRNSNINWLDADRYACRLGLHPMVIWGVAWIEEQPPSTRPQQCEPLRSPVPRRSKHDENEDIDHHDHRPRRGTHP